ncbi:MAG: VOC family protein [Limnobaculum xujianqingii]|uniref:VOC family protein n=1 Tax=Limnobaculum xujianqingii TaxID=2738837 RepID=UPI001E44BD51|nr:VOC family protein [Limnobaculum xujianqingii]
MMEVQPYLFFAGNCEEALQFYQRSIGARITLIMRYSESPDALLTPVPDEWKDKIMHANVNVGHTQFMASDGQCDRMHPEFNGFSLSLKADSKTDAERLFKSLSSGGKVNLPFQRTFWSSGFGMLTDRYGVGWMIMSEIGT